LLNLTDERRSESSMLGFFKRRKPDRADSGRKNCPRVDPVRCLRCGACAAICPLNVIEVSDTLARITTGCNNCGLCIRACPLGGITQ
jgi:electron transport complex protein RnfB